LEHQSRHSARFVTYPFWKNAVNLAAGSSLQYKYYRKNADGSVTWECYLECTRAWAIATPSGR
jgi:hypothetical protein